MRSHYRTYTPAQLVIWIPQLIAQNNLHFFYCTHAWIHLRNEVLKESHNECQICKAKGLYVPATTVHHIRTVREAPWLALTKNNLLAVCDDCHYNIHHRQKPKWDDERW
jgi:5-methylcytosine-specific restriction endonuclease McrA